MIQTLLPRMLNTSPSWVALFACLLGANQAQDIQAAQANPGQAQATWKEGLAAPPLRLPTIDGTETIDLAELRGGPVLLLEFASW